MIPLRILFRTSGGKASGKELGLGHIFRCIHLANKLRSNMIYFLIEDYGNVKKILKEKHFKNIILQNPNIDLISDIKKTKEIINKNKIDIVIVDKYKTKKKFLHEIRKISKLVFISDLNNNEYPADVLINGFIGLRNQITTNKYGAKCFLGPKYQILDDKYAKNSSIKKKKWTLLATFGGYDEHNLSELLCNILSKYDDKIKTRLILGPSTSKSDVLLMLQKKHAKSISIISHTNNMQKEILNSKFGICSGGITSYEFAIMKIPFSIVCQYKHQMITAKQWHKYKLAKNLGFPSKSLPKKIDNFLKEILENKFHIDSDQRIIDGFGTRRVAKEILSLNAKIT